MKLRVAHILSDYPRLQNTIIGHIEELESCDFQHVTRYLSISFNDEINMRYILSVTIYGIELAETSSNNSVFMNPSL